MLLLLHRKKQSAPVERYFRSCTGRTTSGRSFESSLLLPSKPPEQTTWKTNMALLRQGLTRAVRSLAARRTVAAASRSFSIAPHAADKFVVVRTCRLCNAKSSVTRAQCVDQSTDDGVPSVSLCVCVCTRTYAGVPTGARWLEHRVQLVARRRRRHAARRRVPQPELAKAPGVRQGPDRRYVGSSRTHLAHRSTLTHRNRCLYARLQLARRSLSSKSTSTCRSASTRRSTSK